MRQLAESSKSFRRQWGRLPYKFVPAGGEFFAGG
jgi:hypothetical protein